MQKDRIIDTKRHYNASVEGYNNFLDKDLRFNVLFAKFVI